MIREEAIELIHDIQTDAVSSILPEEKEALDMAISALSVPKSTDLISREEVMKAFYKCRPRLATDNLALENMLSSLPSAVPEREKGEWIESKERSRHWYCSVCGGIHTDPETGKWRETFDYRYPFCPNCGADMRGE